ncbi:hypothetical protein [Jeotgalibaca sp. A127]|uniref:hypothetical protein n=1 Tax=Jeotgalibaca sp. A127 TaxID=3457324 RepID=UPI003FD0A356
MKYLQKRLKEKPFSFFVGWIGIVIILLNNQFFQGRFLYSEDFSFLTSNASGIIFFMFFLLSAIEIINFDIRGKDDGHK